jgi:chromosome segregation ATPase
MKTRNVTHFIQTTMKLFYFYLYLTTILRLDGIVLTPCDALRPPTTFPPFNLIQRLLKRRLPKTSVLVDELQDKIKSLERDLYASREQVHQLKSLLNEHHHMRRLGVVNEVLQIKQYQHSESLLKEQIETLNLKIEDLSKSKGEMETLLMVEKSQVQELRQTLSDELNAKSELEQRHHVELSQLRNEMDRKIEEVIHNHSEDNELKMTEEIEKVKNKLKVERKQFKKEKQELLDAVEAEKVKMRRLVKVLAEKEKREVDMNRASLDHDD